MNIEFLNKNTYLSKVNRTNDDYWLKSYESRWEYISIVIDELIKLQPNKVIELGAYKINLTNVSDNIDKYIENIDIDNINNKNFIQNACKLPYDIEDKYYDVFIGLQVFEHLDGKQKDVFNEISRISNYAILSFPYKWNTPNNKNHHNIDDNTIRNWTNNQIPIKIIEIGKRIIYIFKF